MTRRYINACFLTLLICELRLRFESRSMPRFLTADEVLSLQSSRRINESKIPIVALRVDEKIISLIFFHIWPRQLQAMEPTPNFIL
jgi:hypothetical protein